MIVKQGELRSNLKKYFDMAVDDEPVLVPRKGNRNVIILSEDEYRALSGNTRLLSYANAFAERTAGRGLRDDISTDSESVPPKVRSYTETTDIKTDNLDRLKVIGELKDNWNGNGARAFDPGLIKKVIEIVMKIDIQPEIFPSAMGTIEFEYGNSRRDFMSIEIGNGDTAEVFIVMYNGREIFEDIEASSDAINERTKRFYE
ncbi:MAG: type II toxin-antitoxin system Phd/YefM family antitoxin [Lachnospiraceae bacterium]|nr:type II toxin-antitoxin system Phd/YefM family antitoxin [Lachnospiraceae bacterium]